MKKLLITALTVGSVFGASAFNTTIRKTPVHGLHHVSDLSKDIKVQGKEQKSIIGFQDDSSLNTRAGEFGEGQWFSYCGEFYQGLGPGAGDVSMEAAIEIPEEIAQSWTGLQLTKVNIGFGECQNKNVMIYVTKDITGYPEYMEDVTIENENSWNEFTLETPYTFDGSKVYIGYQVVTRSEEDYPIGVDGIGTYLELGDLIGVENEFENYGLYFGSVCIQIEVSGDDMKPFDAYIEDLQMPEFVEIDQPFSGYFTIINTGKNPITNMGLDVTVNGKKVEPQISLYEGNSLPFGTYTYVILEGLTCDVTGSDIPVEVTLTSVSGPAGTADMNQTVDTDIISASTLYALNLAVEEFTGTWCGFCPRGMVGMEYMEQNYGNDGFIGIAVHGSSTSAADPMEVESYLPVINAYSQGSFPSAVLNRAYYFDPSAENFEYYYSNLHGTATVAGVELTAEYDADENVINATATTEFSFDSDNAAYALAFVITENNVGPYFQTNYFANGAYGDMGGWESKARRVETMYNHVARNIDSAFGISGSVPTTITENTPYTFSAVLSTDNVTDINNCHVTALLLDTFSGVVVNSAQVSLTGQGGVESILEESTNGVFKVYNLQGVKVLETQDASSVYALPAGIYVVNGKKVVI